MDHTQFAGLTTLLPDDPITSDGGAFLDRNLRITDHYLAIGAKTHRHDGHPGVSRPPTGPGVATLASGGSIDPATVGYFAVTALDVDGGETLISPLGSAVTPNPFPAPTMPPSAHADYTAGTLRADTYYYGVTLVDGLGGETTISPHATVNRQPGFASGQVLITSLDTLLATAPGAVGWAIYRAAAGGQWAYLVTGSGASFADTGMDCVDCLRGPPTYNTTLKTTAFVVTLPPIPSGATAIRVYGGIDPDLPNPALVGTYPISSAGVGVVTVPSMAFGLGVPPPVSTSVGGADPIGPTNIAAGVPTYLAGASGAVGSAAVASGWARPAVFLMGGAVDLEGVWVGSGSPGYVIAIIPPDFRPHARYPLEGLVVASARGPHVAVDVWPTGELKLVDALAPGASAAVSLAGRWRL